jgi:exodeoxyribonuclease X
MRLMFADTETTGTEAEDRLCQLAFRCGELDVNELYNPPVKISHMAMSVHHITRAMVADKPAFIGSPHHTLLAKVASKVIFVAHNASFDLKMLAKEGIEFPHYIDTLKVARHLDDECKMECYKLQYLRYRLGMDIEAVAHDAWGDILVLEQLYLRLLKSMMKRFDIDEDEARGQMLEISMVPSIIRKIQFGKHKGRLTADIAKEDRGYLEWLLKEKLKEPDGEEDWIYTLNQLLA